MKNLSISFNEVLQKLDLIIDDIIINSEGINFENVFEFADFMYMGCYIDYLEKFKEEAPDVLEYCKTHEFFTFRDYEEQAKTDDVWKEWEVVKDKLNEEWEEYKYEYSTEIKVKRIVESYEDRNDWRLFKEIAEYFEDIGYDYY